MESKGNVRKRKIAVPLLMILGIVIIFSSIFLIINSPAILWYIYMVLGIVCLLLAFNAKSFQKFVLKKAELLLDKSFRTGIVTEQQQELVARNLSMGLLSPRLTTGTRQAWQRRQGFYRYLNVAALPCSLIPTPPDDEQSPGIFHLQEDFE